MSAIITKPDSLIVTIAERYNVPPAQLLPTLKATAFKIRGNQEISNEQMMSLLVVANMHRLNPFTKELYAYVDKSGGIVPVVGFDGWNRIINEHPQFDGLTVTMPPETEEPRDPIDKYAKPCPPYMSVVIHRRDRQHNNAWIEYLDECYVAPYMKEGKPILGPWQTHTKRMLRHKSIVQAARATFSFAGIYDQDEAQRIVDGDFIDVSHEHVEKTSDDAQSTKTESVKERLRERQK